MKKQIPFEFNKFQNQRKVKQPNNKVIINAHFGIGVVDETPSGSKLKEPLFCLKQL